jgi:anhydro-N-acetylmuramic acid kinase
MIPELPKPEEWLSHSRYVLGIMTGTSVDAVDMTLAKFFRLKSGKYLFSIVEHSSFEIPEHLRIFIQRAIDNEARTSEIAYLNSALARYFAEATRIFLHKSKFPLNKLDAIGVHGQTVWHEPRPSSRFPTNDGFTLQLCSIGTMTQILKVPVVGDFRSKDVAAEGEGAPLVPIFDFYFLRSKTNNVIALNIGGIANITYLPANCKISQVVAFDTGPGNTMIDTACRILFGKKFDSNGDIARLGKVSTKILKQLKAINFVRQKPPKSTGREMFSTQFVADLIEKAQKSSILPENIIATLTYFTAWSIAENIRLFANPNALIIVTAGGAKIIFLMEQIHRLLPESAVRTSEEFGIPVEAKESLAFAFLAYLRLGNIPSNLPNVTGAKAKVVLGNVAY